MPDKSANKVHLMYLPLLADLDWAGLYNWGLTCLAHLYKEKCRTIYPTSKKGRMCSVVTVLGMVSHVVHSTKDRASVVISTCNLVNVQVLVELEGWCYVQLLSEMMLMLLQLMIHLLMRNIWYVNLCNYLNDHFAYTILYS